MPTVPMYRSAPNGMMSIQHDQLEVEYLDDNTVNVFRAISRVMKKRGFGGGELDLKSRAKYLSE